MAWPIPSSDLAALERACKIVVEIHEQLVEIVRPGVTLGAIDKRVSQILDASSAKSAFRHYAPAGYRPFPSFSCLSVNDIIVHGTAGMSLDPLKPGDIISIDIGTNYQGWIGDAAWTYIIEHAPETTHQLCNAAIRSLNEGIEQLQPGRPLRDWAATVQRIVEQDNPFHCVQGLGGHAIGHNELHGSPHVANAIPRYRHEWTEIDELVKPGMILAVEPIIAVGTSRTDDTFLRKNKRDRFRQWPIRTADRSLAVHYEHDVLITDTGPRVLTAGLNDLPIILG